MTINGLLKLVPEDKRDYFVVIEVMPDIQIENDLHPLIEVTIDDIQKRVIIEGDWS